MDASVPQPDIERRAQLLDALAATTDTRLAETFLTEVVGLIGDAPHTLNLKIASAAITEMRDAFSMFQPYHGVPKVTVFGSARTAPADPLYQQTARVARRLSQEGWMVVTGAGPGIMQAGMEGAGRESSIGVSIRLPFEEGANSIIAGDAKHVAMKYFFTRKLMLVKESAAFICLPGGFGTLDETFELLTLTQTGKGVPVPIVFLDTPGDPYWEQVHRFVEEQLVSRGFVSAGDVALYKITDSCDVAVDEITRFYANYHSIRQVGRDLVIRLRTAPTDTQLAVLNDDFGHLADDGVIRRVDAYDIERRQADHVDLARLALRFDHRKNAQLRLLIDRLNSFV